MSNAKSPMFEVYKLDPAGRTYHSAAMLSKAMNNDGQDGGNLPQKLYDAVMSKYPGWLQDTGLTSPATQVKIHGLPRAYHAYPIIYVPNKKYGDSKPDLYFYAPIDYKGAHFVPADARKLDAKEAEIIGLGLFMGGWSNPICVLGKSDIGVAMPEDFNPATDSVFSSYTPLQTETCFIAQGRSMECLRDMKQRKQEWRDACEAVYCEIEKIIPILLGTKDALAPADANKLLGKEDVYINRYTYSDEKRGGETKLCISVREKHSSNPIEPLNSAYFLVRKTLRGDYEVGPNIYSAEGKPLKNLLDAVPRAPSAADYPELIDRKDAPPRIQELLGKTLLIYTHPANAETGFCPPGAQPIGPDLRQWLDQDESDKRCNIQPPPMPENLAKLFAKHFGAEKTPARPVALPSPEQPSGARPRN
ncbi:MAG: hypothetical protein WCD70_05875 [Alphaproteobacteria bacterium]